MNESTPFALGSLSERIANWLYVLDKRIFILEPTIRYLQDRSLWIYDETTANIIDLAGLEYGVHLNAGVAHYIQALNTFCIELGPDAWEAGLQLEEEGITIDIQEFIEDHRPTVSKREDDEQLQHALEAAIAEHRRLCRVRLAALKRLRDLSQTEGSQIGHSYQVDMGTGSFWEILTVPNVKKGCQYKLPSTEDHMENVLSTPWEYKIYETLQQKYSFGQSKHTARAEGSASAKIFSFNTYRTYYRHCKFFESWLKENHAAIRSLKHARKYVKEWLEYRAARGLSPWTLHVDKSAVCKLFGIKPGDQEYFRPPARKREDIKRSRDRAAQEQFEKKDRTGIADFCKATGVRRNILLKLEPRDFWSRDRMERAVRSLEGRSLTVQQQKHLGCLKDALRDFPDIPYFISNRSDKGGRYRFSPVIGSEEQQQKVVECFRNRAPGEKLWGRVNTSVPVHAFRADYAAAVYRRYARPVSEIPFDRTAKGGRTYQSGVYICKKDLAGKRYDRRALLLVSKALGHNRGEVVARNYSHKI